MSLPENPLMNYHPAEWCKILHQLFGCWTELLQLSGSKASAACNVGSRRGFLLWLLDLRQIKSLETAFLKQPVSHKTETAIWKERRDGVVSLDMGLNLRQVLLKSILSLPFSFRFLWQKEVISVKEQKLYFVSASLTRLPSSSLVPWIPIRKLFCIFMSFSWLLCS